MNVVLISTYELGRQPFGLASPAAWLREVGASVTSLDLAVQPLSRDAVASADLIAFYIPMHTATRIAAGLVEKVRELNPSAHLCFYGLYASVNEPYLRRLGAGTILGGEFEQGLVELVKRLSSNGSNGTPQPEPVEATVSLGRQQFLVPDRSDLVHLSNYARLNVAPGEQKIVGYTEGSRGCKHLCRHCPIVPVYNGNFRIVQRDVVMRDIEQQVAAGAQHITFGDPDFFNGPTHALQIVEALHERFPDITYDVTIKVEHLLKYPQHLPLLRDTGCLFVTSAVESVDERILRIFDKGHTKADFVRVVHMFREIGLNLAPTFVTFTPWTSLTGYFDLLSTLLELDLVENVPPIQYAIRLLIPTGSKLLELPETQAIVGEFDEAGLCYPWTHPDPAVDELYRAVLKAVQQGQARGESRRAIFATVWNLANDALASSVRRRLEAVQFDQAPPRAEVPYLSEPWYC
jgi:radical SAM superfamily enzyme YgiQ (UPF0313 family)